MSAREGLYGFLYLGTACPAGTTNTISLLTGVELSWTQNKKRFYTSGSLHPLSVLRGIIKFDGSFKKAYVDNQ